MHETGGGNGWIDPALYSELLSVVRGRLRAPQDEVEEVLQDVLLAITHNLSEGKAKPGNLHGFVAKATQNRLIDLVRKRSSHDRTYAQAADDPSYLGQDNKDDPEEMVVAVESAALFQMFFDLLRGDVHKEIDDRLFAVFQDIQQELQTSLDDEHWIVLRAHGLNGLGFQACAEVINRSVGYAHNCWATATSVIAAVFERHNIDPWVDDYE